MNYVKQLFTAGGLEFESHHKYSVKIDRDRSRHMADYQPLSNHGGDNTYIPDMQKRESKWKKSRLRRFFCCVCLPCFGVSRFLCGIPEKDEDNYQGTLQVPSPLMSPLRDHDFNNIPRTGYDHNVEYPGQQHIGFMTFASKRDDANNTNDIDDAYVSGYQPITTNAREKLIDIEDSHDTDGDSSNPYDSLYIQKKGLLESITECDSDG